MVCPICQKRKAKRYCPAKGENICSVCCGTEREVTIDCPSDCPHLVASRGYDWQRRQNDGSLDWSQGPFPEARLDRDFITDHAELTFALSYAICLFAHDQRSLVDSDVIAALKSLAETYRTLSSGIYYEKLPDYRLQAELYQALQTALADFKKKQVQAMMSSVRDSEVRDVLVSMAQLGYVRQNGRPKSRAYLDILRRQFRSPELEKLAASNVLILP
ncbi:MAG: hypothetical protein ACLQOO_32510 [Terriglobia bacterium]